MELPSCTLALAMAALRSAVGALSLVTKDCEAFGVYAGNPARRIKERKRDLLELEKLFLADKK
jgi:galactoside O-acetyltransferase